MVQEEKQMMGMLEKIMDEQEKINSELRRLQDAQFRMRSDMINLRMHAVFDIPISYHETVEHYNSRMEKLTDMIITMESELDDLMAERKKLSHR